MPWDIRPIRANEIDEAKKLLSPDAAEPPWNNSYVLLDGKEITGIIGMEARLVGLLMTLHAEPLIMARPSASSFIAFGFMDGMMRAIASANRQYGYGFSIRNANKRFQELAERRLPVTWVEHDGARHYWRAFAG